MKCPNCGAETSASKICEYCNSELPQDKPVVNITNNYYESTGNQNNEPTAGKCPKCGSNNIKFQREKIGSVGKSQSHKSTFSNTRNSNSVRQNAYRTIGLCQNCGHTWNPDSADKGNGSGRKTWLWVLGWIFIFPVPLTILLLRKKDMKPAVKYGIIAAAWLLFLVIGVFGNSETDTPPNETSSITTTEAIVETTVNNNPFARQEKTIRKFVSEFNEISDTTITDIDFIKNHTIAYLIIDGFPELSIKVNNHSEMGFFFTFEFSSGTALLEQYENLIRDIVKVFDANIDVKEKLQKAKSNKDTIIYLSDSISVEYHYIKDAVGYQAADTYIITLTSTDYNK